MPDLIAAVSSTPAANRAAPIRVCEVELSEPLRGLEPAYVPGEANGRRFVAARVLVRWYTEPLALVDVPLAGQAPSAGDLAAALWAHVRPLVTERFAAAGEPAPAALPVAGLCMTRESPYLRRRAEVLATAPPVSVVVPTRDRPGPLARCLDALTSLHYPDFEIIIAENVPVSTGTADLVARRGWPVQVRYVAEHRPGPQWARNAGLAAATGRIVAFIDDDEQPDTHWLAELVSGFAAAPNVAGVGGTILPEALDTLAQQLAEQFVGQRGGFAPQVFDAASHTGQHPLYPLPPFGAGGNMAFDREALLAVGGFDVALPIAEDTAAISDIMLSGRTFVRWPAAVVWHPHHRELPQLRQQVHGYASGLTAFYTRVLLRDPRAVATLARLAPQAARDLRRRYAARADSTSDTNTGDLRRAYRQGLVAGPARYLRHRRLSARLATARGK